MITVLAMGQSNMSGRGTGGPAMTLASGVTVWNNTNEGGANGTAFISPPAATNAPWDSAGGNNLALWFCHRLAREKQDSVRLVLISRGAMAISNWASPSGAMWLETVAVMTAAGVSADIMLWHQGEGDGSTSEADYKAAFLALRSDMITAGYITSGTPIIVGGLATLSNSKLIALANENDSIYFADADDIPDDDGTHFTGSGLFTLGYENYYRAYHDFTGPRIIAGAVKFGPR